jgi:hypothetical protein
MLVEELRVERASLDRTVASWPELALHSKAASARRTALPPRRILKARNAGPHLVLSPAAARRWDEWWIPSLACTGSSP